MSTARIALLLAVALVIAACGSGLSQSDNPDPVPDSTAPPTTTTVLDNDSTTDNDPTSPDSTNAPEPPVTTTSPPVIDDPDANTDADSETGDTEVVVYLLSETTGTLDYGCGYVTAAPRLVSSPAVLAGAIESLFGGPTEAELADGLGSWFSEDVGWGLSSVTILNGVAYIDLSDDSEPIPNASTSCGSMALLAQLDYTATQFPTVDRAVYSFDGDVAAFYHWLERDVPQL